MEGADEITQWLASRGRRTLDREAARQLALDSPEHWYVAACGARGYMVGKMTMQKFSQRHIVVDGAGEPMLFPTVEAALQFLRGELGVTRPHVFNY